MVNIFRNKKGKFVMRRDDQEYDEPTLFERQERLLLATRFLDEELLPRLKSNEEITSDWLIKAFNEFCDVNALVASSFDLGHVWLVAWQRDVQNQCLSESNPQSVSPGAVFVAKATRLLEQVVFAE